MQCMADMVFDGLASVKEYASSPWAIRGFCAQCGTHLFYQKWPRNPREQSEVMSRGWIG
ncbi:MAG: hypothetical protein ACI96W_002278 [Paraglaciecola sp.]|jgi:hypothetical protein